MNINVLKVAKYIFTGSRKFCFLNTKALCCRPWRNKIYSRLLKTWGKIVHCFYQTLKKANWKTHITTSSGSQNYQVYRRAMFWNLFSPFVNQDLLKSVQLILSHLQSPLEWIQSQLNYGSFLSKSYLHGTILHTMLAQNCPKSKQEQFAISGWSTSNRGKQMRCLRSRGK